MGALREISYWGRVSVVTRADAFDSFTPLQLDTLHALWSCYALSSEHARPMPFGRGAKNPAPQADTKCLRRFSIGTEAVKPGAGCDGQVERAGQVYDVYSPYWLVRFRDDEGNELTASGMKRYLVRRFCRCVWRGRGS